MIFQKLTFAFVLILNGFNVFSQEKSVIDILRYNIYLKVNDDNKNIEATNKISIKSFKNNPEVILDFVYKTTKSTGMIIEELLLNNKIVPYELNDKKILIKSKNINVNDTFELKVKYKGIPVDGLIISTNMYATKTFFTDNWPNRAKNWLPCVDHPNDKAAVKYTIEAPLKYDIVCNGKEIEKKLNNNYKISVWEENIPISTKIFAIGIAKFEIENSSNVRDIPIYSYVFPENKIQGFKDYKIAGDIIKFYETKLPKFPFKKLANIQSKTIFGGMENAGAIFYNETSVTNPEIESLMAHEIAHQWFGDMVSETDFAHLWLSEGFATFLTHYYMYKKYGDELLQKRLLKDSKKIKEFFENNSNISIVREDEKEYMKLLNAYSYEKGGYFLNMLMNKLGERIFWKGINNYYDKYKSSNANTQDFKVEMENISNQKLDTFFNQWLYQPQYPKLKIVQNKIKKTIKFEIIQTQDYLFSLPLYLSFINKKGKEIFKTINITKPKEVFELSNCKSFKTINFNYRNINLIDIEY